MLGRPPILLDDIRAKRIIDAIGKGHSRTAAASAGRISRSLLLDWLARGRDGEAPFADFLDRVRAAEAKAEGQMVDCIRAAALDPKYWQAAAWWLERCRPADFAKREPTREDETERAETGLSDLETLRSLTAAVESRQKGTGTDGPA